MIDKNIKIHMPEEVEIIIRILNENDFEAFIVGGCVRDSLLDKKPKDWDITTNASPEDIISVFKEQNYRVIETGLKHGTVTVVINRENFEITTYRIDGEYLDNRRPLNVIFTSSLEEDLRRRDFTINAMAYNHSKGLIDYHHGLTHLENKIIKAVGEAEKRFNEDALRMLRAIRFACQLNFNLDEEINVTLYKTSGLLKNISEERIKDELCKILISDFPAVGIKLLMKFNLMKYIIPELYECENFNQLNKHHDKDVLQHTLGVLDNTPPKMDIRLAALLHDIAKPRCFTVDETGQGHFLKHNIKGANMAKDILKRLKFDNRTIEKVYILIFEHMSRFKKTKDSTVKRFIGRVGKENLEDLFMLQIADSKACAKEYANISEVLNTKARCEIILEENQPLTIKDLKIGGKELMELGVLQGKIIGVILDELLDLVLENSELNHKEKLIEIVKSSPSLLK